MLLAGAVAGPAIGAPLSGSLIDNTAASTFVDFAALNRLSNTVRTIALATGAVTPAVTESAPAAATPSSDLSFVVAARVSGPVSGVAVFINGVGASLVTLREPLPANTSYAAAAPSAGMQVYFHRRGDADNQFQTTADPATTDAVIYAVATLSAGQSLGGTTTVRVAGNAGGVLTNQSVLAFTDLGVARTQTSNTVQVVLPTVPSTLAVFGTNAYARPVTAIGTGSPLFLQLDASRCNIDAGVAESRLATVRSQGTGDVETVALIETGTNTGLFRAVQALPSQNARGNPQPGDGVLQTYRGDSLTASVIGCGSDAVSANILVDPAGTVFDSHSNIPVSGSVVTLIDVSGAGNGNHPGEAAKVFGFDGVTAAPATVTVDATGMFQFPNVAASQYRLALVLPPGYHAPSVVKPAQLPVGRLIDAMGSYGGSFAVAGSAPVFIDVPVDTAAIDGLFVEKTASKSIAEIGDFVDYVVTVRNTSAAPIVAVMLHDQLPRGFAYQAETIRVNGVQRLEPMGKEALMIPVGNVASGAQAVISYRLRLGVGAAGGEGVNRAYASAGASQSNISTAKVLLNEGGVFSDRGYLIGKVYADCNRNRIQDSGEPGIPGVRIVLEDGTSAVTDENGKYSLYGLLPRTHVAKVDATTLPVGTALEVLDNRNVGDGRSRFIDLKSGELHRGDFAVDACGPASAAEITRRRGALTNTETGAASRALLTADRSQTTTDPRSLPASGTLDAKGIVGRTGLAAVTAARGRAAVAASVVETPVVPEVVAEGPKAVLGPLLEKLDPALGFIGLVDGETTGGTRITVDTKGPAGLQWKLEVNNVVVGDDHVGERSTLAERGIGAVSYIGVDLAVGPNRLHLIAADPFGNIRGQTEIKVIAPGDLASVLVDLPPTAVGDGVTPVKIHLRLVDASGTLVPTRTAVTVDATAGALQVKDVDPRESGVQIWVTGGEAVIELMPPADPAKGIVRAVVGRIKTDAAIEFAPNLRPLIAVGVVEGVINLRSLGSNALVATQSGDAFEREIQNVSRQLGNNATAAARGALYLKGKVAGSALLTLAYDSDKPQRERLFRDIQPDQFYPVYGDSSVKGFDAQSTSRLYVRVDRDQSFVLYGDLVTPTDNPARGLTQYNRALTGAQSHVEVGPVSVDAFAANATSRQQIDELRADGTSGPYALSRTNGLVNSESVHILTRDRNQPAVILKDVQLTRFADYEMEPFTGRILFKAPISSVDIDLNPLSIRVTYEVDSGGASFFVGGVDAKVKVTDQVTVGGVFIRDTDPANRSTIKGLNTTVQVAEKATVVGEIAETDSDLYGNGRGKRLEYRQETDTVQARVYAGKTDPSFNNPNAALNQGRAEFGAKVGVKVTERDRVTIEAVKTEDQATGGRREGVLATVEHSFDGNVKVEVGARHADETLVAAQPTSEGTTPNRFTSLRSKVTVPVPYLADANVFAEYERAIDSGDTRQIAALGGTYRLPWGGKLYARHEFISSLSGAYDLNSTQRLNTTVFGVDTDYMKDGHAFNEYRVGSGIDGRTSEAAVGLRNLWRLSDGLALTTTGERVTPLSGVAVDKATAVTAAIDYTANPLWKSSARAEYRNATTSDSWLFTTGSAYRWNEEWTLLGKAIYSDLQNNRLGFGVRRISRGQFGGAYRPIDTNFWNALARVEIKRELDTTIETTPIDEIAVIGSGHVNVQPTADLTFNGRYSFKRATDRSNGIESHSFTQLVGGRMVYDLTPKWDVGASAFVLASNGFASRQFALGLEAGYRVQTNLWVSLGYNLSGFRERDLAAEDYTQRGVYLRMRFKFDESVFSRSAAREAEQ